MRYSLFLLFLLLGCSPFQTNEKTEATVTKVISGNTIEVKTKKKKMVTVRILGISSPKLEVSDEEFAFDSMQNIETLKLARQAINFTTKHLLNKRVVLVSPTITFKEDRHGRTLAFVMVGKNDFSELIAREGLVWVYSPTFEPNFMTQRSTIYQQAEAEARQAKRGIWAVIE